jgi:hypothetical protein
MIFFWSDTEAGSERHQTVEDEFSARIKIWASGVSDAQRA